MILYMYRALGHEILMSTFFFFFFFFFMNLYMYIAPGQGQTAPRRQSFMPTEMSCHFVHLLQVSKNVWGQTFDVNRKALSFYPFVASFKEISLKSDSIHFFMI